MKTNGEFKGTPAPWIADGLHIKAKGVAYPIAHASLVDFKHDLRGKAIPDIQGLANAKLMASAPDLLEALINLEALVYNNLDKFTDVAVKHQEAAQRSIQKALTTDKI